MNNGQQRLTFRIHGMDCAEEVASLKRELVPLVGGDERLAFDILNAKLVVHRDRSDVSVEALMHAIERTGMRAETWQEGLLGPGVWQQHGRSLLTLTSALFAAAGFLTHAWLAGGIMGAIGSEGMGVASSVPTISLTLYLLGIVAGVWYVLPKAWRATVAFRPDMNLLMTIAVVGAAAIGEWFEAATVAALFSLSLLLEFWSVGRARRAIAALMDLAPPTARLRDADGKEVHVPPETVAVGEVFFVRPGEKIALDGRVAGGASRVNQAPITGESVPVPKQQGAEVFAGTINGDAVLEIEWTKPAGDTTLAHIIRMVGETLGCSAPRSRYRRYRGRLVNGIRNQ